MMSTPTPRPSQLLPAARDLATLQGAVERLFQAPDASGVVEICEVLLGRLEIQGRLRWRSTDEQPGRLPRGQLDLATDPQGGRVLTLERADQSLADQAQDQLAWLGRIADTRLQQLAETSRLYEAISRLALAERLQRALYAIAEQASAERNMPDMMRALHGIISSLMYAENFYIALYDKSAESVRFPYFVDILDAEPPSPDKAIPLQDILHSITWNLLHKGRSLMGSMAELQQQCGQHLRLIGPSCEHLLGVPLRRAERTVGVIVVQSYRADMFYSQQDLELLNYVAQHVQTALERREAHIELARRVTDRTAALREANRILRQQVLQRQRGERLQAALFRIAELANSADHPEKFYATMH